MSSLELLIQNYGYPAIFIGTILDGEFVLIAAGFLAHAGYFNLFEVLFLGFIATLLLDQSLFFFGRLKGAGVIEKYDFIKRKIKKVHDFIEKYKKSVIFGFRFAFGFRTITPIVLGTSRVSAKKFIVWNVIGALAWTLTFVLLGYLTGAVWETLIGKIRYAGHAIFISIIIAFTLIWVVHYIKKNKE